MGALAAISFSCKTSQIPETVSKSEKKDSDL